MYDWWKPTLASVAMIAGRVNASARNSTSGSVGADVSEQPVPEPERLGVRVVDPEDPHPVIHPEPDDPVYFLMKMPSESLSKLKG